MARLHHDADDDISLFPFLSIIACVIGVLTLMISTLALAQMDSPAVANAERYEQAQKDLAAARAEIAEIEQKLQSEQTETATAANQQQREMTQARETLDQLVNQLEEMKQRQAEQAKIKIVIPTLPADQRETIDDMQSQLAELQERLAQLDKEIKERNLPPEESAVSILPAGSGVDFTPYFVECAAGAIVLHTSVEPLQIRAAEMAANQEFIGVLEKVANQKNATLLFLVRSDGLGTYRMAKALADANEVKNGKLPVVGQGRIDVGFFKKK
jgi:multidrug efflux pump subunit AcrA (membrane-fusion protein)